MPLPPPNTGYNIDRRPKRVYDKEAERWRTNVIYEWDTPSGTREGPSATAVLGHCPSIQTDPTERDWIKPWERKIASYRRHRGTLAHHFVLDWLTKLVEGESLEFGEREVQAYEDLREPDDLEFAANSIWTARRRRIWGNHLDVGRSTVTGWLQAGYKTDEVLDIGGDHENWTWTCYQRDWLLRDCVEEIRLNALQNFRTAVAEELGGIWCINGVERFMFSRGYGGQYDLRFWRVLTGGETSHTPGQDDYFTQGEVELSVERVMADLKFSETPFIDAEGRPLRRAMLQLAGLAETPLMETDRLCVVRCSPLQYPDYEVVWLEDTPWSREELVDEFRKAASGLGKRYGLEY